MALKVVDPHVHIWDVGTGLYPRRAARGTAKTAMSGDYLREDLIEDAGDVEILKAVHIEGFPTDGLAEALHVQALADAAPDGLPQAIVAYANIAAPDADETLARLAAIPNVRGVRQVLDRYIEHFGLPQTDLLREPGWRGGLALLAKHGLSFELQLLPQQMAEAAHVAADHSETAIIVNHTGLSADRSFAGWRVWRSGLHVLGACRNVSIKISGLGMFDADWTVESFRPYVFEALDAFGVDRAMFASNFPVDKRASTYAALWEAFDRITSELSERDREGLFRSNAERFYRI